MVLRRLVLVIVSRHAHLRVVAEDELLLGAKYVLRALAKLLLILNCKQSMQGMKTPSTSNVAIFQVATFENPVDPDVSAAVKFLLFSLIAFLLKPGSLMVMLSPICLSGIASPTNRCAHGPFAVGAMSGTSVASRSANL